MKENEKLILQKGNQFVFDLQSSHDFSEPVSATTATSFAAKQRRQHNTLRVLSATIQQH
jgi:hypothetical protein